jgi:hypothetical protein
VGAGLRSLVEAITGCQPASAILAVSRDVLRTAATHWQTEPAGIVSPGGSFMRASVLRLRASPLRLDETLDYAGIMKLGGRPREGLPNERTSNGVSFICGCSRWCDCNCICDDIPSHSHPTG